MQDSRILGAGELISWSQSNLQLGVLKVEDTYLVGTILKRHQIHLMLLKKQK